MRACSHLQPSSPTRPRKDRDTPRRWTDAALGPASAAAPKDRACTSTSTNAQSPRFPSRATGPTSPCHQRAQEPSTRQSSRCLAVTRARPYPAPSARPGCDVVRPACIQDPTANRPAPSVPRLRVMELLLRRLHLPHADDLCSPSLSLYNKDSRVLLPLHSQAPFLSHAPRTHCSSTAQSRALLNSRQRIVVPLPLVAHVIAVVKLVAGLSASARPCRSSSW